MEYSLEFSSNIAALMSKDCNLEAKLINVAATE